MKCRVWNGTSLEGIDLQDMPQFARQGLYVCCKHGQSGHTHEDAQISSCGFHLWIYAGPDPIPNWHKIKKLIKKEVPHVNGHGTHAT